MARVTTKSENSKKKDKRQEKWGSLKKIRISQEIRHKHALVRKFIMTKTAFC